MRLYLFLLLLIACLAVGSSALNPLFDFINQTDDVYTGDFSYIAPPTHLPQNAVTLHVIQFKSLRWLSTELTDRPEWSQVVAIAVPDVLEIPDLCVTILGSGTIDRTNIMKSTELAIGAQLANSIKSVVAAVFYLPNQAISFNGQSSLIEDGFIGATLKYYLDNFPFAPAHTLGHFPMIKASARSLDVITLWSKAAVAQGLLPVPVSKFYITGASKRGLTSSLLAAYEGTKLKPRLIGVAPLVYDLFNMKRNVLRMRERYHGWTYAFKDYLEQGAIGHLGSFQFDVLSNLLDPVSPLYYIPFARIPKLLVTASNDEFFMIDNDSQFHLPGEWNRLIVPNADHSLTAPTALPQIVGGVSGHVLALYYNIPRARLNWDTNANGKLTLSIWKDQPKPVSVVKYQSNTRTAQAGEANRVDFRLTYRKLDNYVCDPAPTSAALCLNTEKFTAQPLTAKNNLLRWTYEYQEENPPEDKWTGYFYHSQFSRSVNVKDYKGNSKTITLNELYSTSATIWPLPVPDVSCSDWDSCPTLNNLV